METEVIDTGAIEKVCKKLLSGGIVAVPTETVYGLAARAEDPDAVAKIYAVKNRPSDNPLIVHCSDSKQALRLLKDVPDFAKKLSTLWPAPVTLVGISAVSWPQVQAGHDTIAVRVPKSAFFREVISRVGPLAAPSANISGRPSPTTADHCLQDLDGKISLIVDGGPCTVGVESTVVDCTGDLPRILRPGAITERHIEAFCQLAQTTSGVASPGVKHAHYQPAASVEISTTVPRDSKEDTLYIVKTSIGAKYEKVYSSAEDLARNMFAWFRLADECGLLVVKVQAVEEDGIGVAVMDRLRRAARG